MAPRPTRCARCTEGPGYNRAMRLRRETVRWVRFGVYLTAAFVIACGADVPETEPAAAGVPELQPLPSVAPVPEELPELVARVNSHDVTREELEQQVFQI